jgi:hypothetical protein
LKQISAIGCLLLSFASSGSFGFHEVKGRFLKAQDLSSDWAEKTDEADKPYQKKSVPSAQSEDRCQPSQAAVSIVSRQCLMLDARRTVIF